jgi:hypothetical protein
VRLLATESTNKNDPHDALSVAVHALRSKTPKQVGAEDHATVMKLWARRHRNLSSTRTQIACRLHAVLCDPVAGGVPDGIYAARAALLLAEVEPDSAVAAARVELAGELLDELRRVDHQITESKKRLEQVVAASSTTVIDIFGVSPVVAATVVRVTGDIAASRHATGSPPSTSPPPGRPSPAKNAYRHLPAASQYNSKESSRSTVWGLHDEELLEVPRRYVLGNDPVLFPHRRLQQPAVDGRPSEHWRRTVLLLAGERCLMSYAVHPAGR